LIDNKANDGIAEVIIPKADYDLREEMRSYGCDDDLIDLTL